MTPEMFNHISQSIFFHPKIQVFLSSNVQENLDVYRLKIGVRSLHWNSKEFLINGKPIYFRGFGRHEDSDVRFIGFL